MVVIMKKLKDGVRISTYDQEAIPRDNRDGGSSWKGARVYGTVVSISENMVVIDWDETTYWNLGKIEHPISEVEESMRIEKPAAEAAQ